MAQEIALSSLKAGQVGRVKGFTDEKASLKLLEMGLLPGEKVKVERWAPLGCPVLLALPASLLSLRKKEADGILIELVPHGKCK